jgi:hypothetical protein
MSREDDIDQLRKLIGSMDFIWYDSGSEVIGKLQPSTADFFHILLTT